MKFSVLVPVYNVEAYLEQCIESVLNQTYENYELILVDDGSKDNSGEICDKYAEIFPDKIKAIHKENQGVLAARITGIHEAKGDFCIFVDSDDCVEPELLEKIQKVILTENLDILIYSFKYYQNEKKEKRKVLSIENGTLWTAENKKELYLKLIENAEIASIWSKAIKSSILKNELTDYTIYYGKNMGEDLLQSLYPITVADRIMFVDEPLYNYRINEESLSRSFRVETIPNKNSLFVYEKILEYLKIWNMEDMDTTLRLKARWFNDTMYMLSKYYEYAQTAEDRQKVIEYHWESMMPKDAYSKENIYENKFYQELYEYIKNKNFDAVHKHFKKKYIEETKKKIKRKIKQWLKIKN